MTPGNVAGRHANPQVRAQTERLLNLLIALRAKGWIDRDTLRESIEDYRGLDDRAFDRKFSRDKALLRELGIEITTHDWDSPDDGGEPTYGYRITDDGYALQNVVLTRDEAVLLGIATGALADSALATDADRALNKLRGLGVDLVPVRTPQIPGTRLDAGQFTPLLRALGSRTPVGFDYRKPGSAVQSRRLEPYALLNRGDSTYVMGRDIDRDDVRTFRLSRIVGAVRPISSRTAGDYAIPTDFNAADWFDPGDSARSTAVLLLRPGHADPLRRAALDTRRESGGWDRVTVEYEDPETFTDYLLGFGDSLRVEDPPPLVARYREALAHTVDQLSTIGGAS